ncbi:MAG: ABC-F family ATP-binding cassette domain-containing protein [Desulfitobacteriaceae bacterium]
MSILYCRDCGVDVAGEALFRDVSFALELGDKVGLVGPNGAGKTTLIRACLGEWFLESGQVHLTGTVGYLPQTPSLEETGTVFQSMLMVRADIIRLREQLHTLERQMAEEHDGKILERYAALTESYEREGGYALEAQIRKILAGLGLEKEVGLAVSRLSGGQKTRLALGKLLLRSPELLILDEPTNHLDISALEWLEGFLREYVGTVWVVSHDRYFLNRVVKRILHLENGELKEFKGNYSEYELQLAMEEKTMAREADRMVQKIARLEDYVRRNKAGVNAKQARGREAQLRKLLPVKTLQTGKELGITLESFGRSGERVLYVEGLTIKLGSRVLFSQVDLDLRRKERVALLGRNGVGKTSFLRAILQQLPYQGTIRLGANVKLGYYSQEHEELNPLNTVIDEIRQASDLEDPEIRSLLARYGFRAEEVFKPVKVLSGGEKSRLALCKLFLVRGNFLLLDEPTNHLDGATREVLEEALEEYDGTFLVVSHDRYFLDKLVNKILELTPNGLEVFEGDYTEYRENKLSKLPSLTVTQDRSKENSQKLAREEQRRQKKVRQLEDEIAGLEDKLRGLEEELALCASDYEKAMQLHKACEETRVRLDEVLTDWTLASEV